MLLFVLVLGSQNSEIISVNFLIVKQNMSVAALLSLGLIVGGLAVFLLFSFWNMKMLMKLRALQKEAKNSPK